MLKLLFAWFSQLSRRRRADILKSKISLPPSASILDLGGGTGYHIRSLFHDLQNIWVADISETDLAIARQHGLRTVQLTENATLPFQDKQFDFCFCSSVIEHATGEKRITITMKDDDQFKALGNIRLFLHLRSGASQRNTMSRRPTVIF
jgi:ubiquinone/menaquinone biosynthesis C-methylase UbiE